MLHLFHVTKVQAEPFQNKYHEHFLDNVHMVEHGD